MKARTRTFKAWQGLGLYVTFTRSPSWTYPPFRGWRLTVAFRGRGAGYRLVDLPRPKATALREWWEGSGRRLDRWGSVNGRTFYVARRAFRYGYGNLKARLPWALGFTSHHSKVPMIEG